MSDSFYKVLGVDEKASKDEIKRSYRTLQMKYHPDKNNNSQDAVNMTQKLNEAYETLGDDEKREEYDSTRNNPFLRGGSNVDVQMDDIINMMFGGMGIPGMQMGGIHNMQMGGFPGMQMGGLHSFPGMPPGTKIHFFQGGNPINFQQLQKPQSIYVTVPKGVDDGEMVLLKDKGNVMNENCKGDIKIFVKIENDSIFRRAGLDLVLEKKITLKEALCGFSFEINYINGKSYTLNNNVGNIIPHGFKKVIPNMGLERDQHKGNMVIEFNVQFPEKLSESVINLLKNIDF